MPLSQAIGLVRHGGHGLFAILLAVEPDDLGGERGFARGADRATLGHDHAPFIQGGRIDVCHFEKFRGQTMLPEDRLAALAAFHVQKFGIVVFGHALECKHQGGEKQEPSRYNGYYLHDNEEAMSEHRFFIIRLIGGLSRPLILHPSYKLFQGTCQ